MFGLEGGLFHSVPDNGDLPTAMANYYSVFATGLQSCDLRWIKYADVVTGTELLAGCLPVFERSSGATCDTSGGGGGGDLLGVTCMDMNIIGEYYGCLLR